MKIKDIDEIEEIKTLSVKDDDIIIVKCKVPVRHDVASQIQRVVKKTFGEDRKVIVTENNMDMESTPKEIAKRILENLL